MLHRCSFALAVLASSAACGSQDSDAERTSSARVEVSAPPVDPSLLAGFVAFESKVGRYRLRVPAKPEIKSDPMTLAGKTFASEWMHSTIDGRAAYMAQWNEAPPEATANDYLATYVRTIMSGVGASVLSIDDTRVLGDVAAVEATGKHPRTGAVYLRVFVIDGSVYRLMASGVAEARARAYFASFERI